MSVDLSDLMTMDRATLANCWSDSFGCPAPRHSQSIFLRSALAWHRQMTVQAKTGSGGVDRLIRGLRRKAASVAPVASMAPGTRLLREWQGTTHHVTVLAQGFEYGGKTYKSLTAIARTITGTAWSGPLFFGLRS
jgi:hypothetical protein